MKTWDYANLSKLAKANGGPEELVDKLVNSGKLQMLPWIGVAFGCGIAATKLVQYFKRLKAKSTAELEAAKQEIIRRYQNGERLDLLCKEFHHKYDSIRTRLVEKGIKINTHAGPMK